MKLDATPETVAAIAQVLKLAGYLDDKIGQPDKGRIMAWSEQVQRHNLAEADLLDGLQAYYDGSHDGRPIGVGDLIQHAKVARQVRQGRESKAEREARQPTSKQLDVGFTHGLTQRERNPRGLSLDRAHAIPARFLASAMMAAIVSRCLVKVSSTTCRVGIALGLRPSVS